MAEPTPDPNATPAAPAATAEVKPAASPAPQADPVAALAAAGLRVVVDKETGKPQLVKTVTVAGEQRDVMLSDLETGYTKAAGADARFQEAARLREKANNALRVMDTLQRLRTPNLPPEQQVQLMQELGVAIGQTPEEIAQEVQFMSEITKGGSPSPAAAAPAAAQPAMPTRLEDYPAPIQEAVRYADTKRAEERRNQIYDLTEKSVDEDPILSTMDNEGRKTLKTLAKNEVQRRVIVLRETFGPDLVVSVLEGLRPLARLGGKSMSGSPSNAEAAEQALQAQAHMEHMYPGISQAFASLPVEPVAGAGSPMLQAGNSVPPNSRGTANQPVSVLDERFTADFMAGVRRKLAAARQARQAHPSSLV